MRVVITGGAGLVGSSMSALLLEQGAEVFCYDNLSLGTLKHLEAVSSHRQFHFEKKDVSQDNWFQTLKGKSFDLLIHLAANSDISLGNTHPEMDMQRTFLTTFWTLQAARHLKIKNFLFSSTSAVYGANAPLPTPESIGNLHPVSIYGAGKLASENFISAFVENYDLNAWVFRFGNVCGQRLTHGVIWDFIKKLKTDSTKLKVLGNGRQAKTYIHVEDCVQGMLWAFNKSKPTSHYHQDRFQVFNLSSSGVTTVREIANEVVRVAGQTQTQIEYGESSIGWVGDVAKTSLCTKKMQALGFEPKRQSTAAVFQAIADFNEWYKTFNDN